MQCNVGLVDQGLRIAVGLVAIGIGIYYQSLWGFLGMVPLLTGLARWCPAYSLLRLSSAGKKEKAA